MYCGSLFFCKDPDPTGSLIIFGLNKGDRDPDPILVKELNSDFSSVNISNRETEHTLILQ